jgi:peptidyl-prolyl cis-trans isomerase D
MLASFRAIANTWPARLFFFALAISFVGWGVADVARNIAGNPNAVGTINGAEVTQADFAFAYGRDVKEAAAKLKNPSDLPVAERQQIARRSLQTVMFQTAYTAEAHKLGLAMPDAELLAMVSDMSAFKGRDGHFDRNKMLEVLANNQITEQRFGELMHDEELRMQLIDTVTGQGHAPDTLTQILYRFLDQARSADTVLVPLPSMAAAADEPVLRRYWSNHRERYAIPEYRHIKLVTLSAATIGPSMPVGDDEIANAYKFMKARYEQPEKRSAQVISANSLADAQTLLAAWRRGADWASMQKEADKLHAVTVEISDQSRAAIPSPDLGNALFAAKAGSVIGPVNGLLGVQVARLTSILAAKTTPMAVARAEIKQHLGEMKAADLLDQRSQKLEDMFAGGATLDEVPSDMGAAASAGTLDANGKTEAGTDAPLPGTAAFKQDLIKAVFAAKIGDPVQLNEGQDRIFYAFSVDKIIPGAVQPYDAVRARVLAEYQHDQQRHAAETTAATLLHDVQSGKNIMDAAAALNLPVNRTAPMLRNHASKDLPGALPDILFGLQQGDAAMAEVPGGFMVFRLADIITPDLDRDPAGYATLKQQLASMMGNDLLSSYGNAITANNPPKINNVLVDKLIEQLAQ